MTVSELITKLQQFPDDMDVKVVTVAKDDVLSVVQNGEDFVQLVVGSKGKCLN